MRMTNNAGVDLAVALWLAHDDYDYVAKEKYISATTLLKPIRQVILGMRVPAEQRIPDIIERVNSVIGQTLHTGVEHSWKLHYKTSMAKLGFPQRVIDMVRINPEVEEPDTIPVYTEQRVERSIDGWIVGGKLDLIIEGRLRDVKSTKVYKYTSQSSVGKWREQGSIYRWLNPEKVHHDEFLVQYVLLDWNRGAASREPGYPATPVPVRSVELMGLAETEQFIRNRLRLLEQYADAPEADLPDCPDEDLWRSDPVWKYYADATKTSGRSTKNFDDETTAHQHRAAKGKGVVILKPGQVKACDYCEVAALCSQRQRLLLAGELAASE